MSKKFSGLAGMDFSAETPLLIGSMQIAYKTCLEVVKAVCEEIMVLSGKSFQQKDSMA